MTATAQPAAPATTDVVRTEHLTKHFPMRHAFGRKDGGAVIRAVDGVDLSIAPGTTLGLVGESGSGKSTVARLVLRLMPPTSGQVYLDGKDVTNLKGDQLRLLRRNMQLVFQDPYSSFDPHATVVD